MFYFDVAFHREQPTPILDFLLIFCKNCLTKNVSVLEHNQKKPNNFMMITKFQA